MRVHTFDMTKNVLLAFFKNFGAGNALSRR